MKTINQNGTFRKRSPYWNFLKTLFSRLRVDMRKRNFSKTLRSHYQFQSTPRNISVRSRVSHRFQIDSSHTCGRAKTLRVDANFFEDGENNFRFQTNTDTCGSGLKFILGSEACGNNKRNALFIIEPQDDLFCFIPPSLAAKYEF